jgi:hypothetical protein
MTQLFLAILLFSDFLSPRAIRSGQQITANGHRPTVKVQRISFIPIQLSAIDRPAFYKAMEENNRGLVNEQLKVLDSAPETERQAFMGAMLMKKAGFRAPPPIKLRTFKSGHKMLEAAIKQDPVNAEFRFLRLVVQEHAPDVLGYKKDIQTDTEYIRKYYKSLPDEVQRIIEDYSKKSKFLKLDVS